MGRKAHEEAVTAGKWRKAKLPDSPGLLWRTLWTQTTALTLARHPEIRFL